MYNKTELRIIEEANLMIKTKATVRMVADQIGVSKSTVHSDLTEKLKEINMGLYIAVKKVLESNKQQRSSRGGQAVRKRCLGLQY